MPTTTRVVTVLGDTHVDGKLTLREAMTDLLTVENDNDLRVEFDPSIRGGTITLDPAKGQLPDVYKQATFDHTWLTVAGSSSGMSIQRDANAQQQHRLFFNGTGTTLTLLNLGLYNGTTDVGGAVSSQGDLTIQYCDFSNNRVTGRGGAINFTNGGTLQILDSSFEQNSALLGGAIYITGTAGSVTIADTSITQNTATDSGGGIYIVGSDTQTATPVYLYNVEVGGNLATNKGGGIYVDAFAAGAGTALTLDGNCTVHDNKLVNPKPTYVTKGGGIYFGKGTLTATSVTISGNTAKKGTGLYLVTGATLDGTPTYVPPNSQDGGDA